MTMATARREAQQVSSISGRGARMAPATRAQRSPVAAGAQANETGVPLFLAGRGAPSARSQTPSPAADAGGTFDASPLPDASVAEVRDAGPRDAAAEPLHGGIPATPGMLDAHYGTCGSEADTTARNAFAARAMHLERNIPSTGQGMFDADYLPTNGNLWISFNVMFNFVPATSAPDPFTRLLLEDTLGIDLSPLYWTAAEQSAFEVEYMTRINARWSGQHNIVSSKPCWGFSAMPQVAVFSTSSPDAAHYVYTVHKQPSGFAYQSATGYATPTTAGTGDLWSSDVQENQNFASGVVATNERSRIETALAAAGASPVLFERDSAELGLLARLSLAIWASVLNTKQPSDPLIPIKLDGFASAEGGEHHNRELSTRRAEAVRDVLLRMGVRQPIVLVGRGPFGAPNDAANRKVDITVDHAFETAYSANRYSVAEHEFGHAMGLPDEYLNNAPGSAADPQWIASQTQAQALFTAAGVQGPAAWGNYTSSTMAGGVDILPRHYVTFWEALARMTSPDITQAEWRIV